MVPRRKKPVLWASSVSCIKPRTRRGAHTRITALSTPGGKLGAATPAPLDHAPACHEVGVRWGGSFREGECRTSGVVRMGGQACGEGEGEGSIFWNGEAQRHCTAGFLWRVKTLAPLVSCTAYTREGRRVGGVSRAVSALVPELV